MNQGVSRYLLIWKPGYLLTCDLGQVHLSVTLMNKRVERDSLRIYGKASMEFTLASDKAHFSIIEMPQEKPC